jgi:hypothetical protein
MKLCRHILDMYDSMVDVLEFSKWIFYEVYRRLQNIGLRIHSALR